MKCAKCNSNKVRIYDNQGLYHPTKEMCEDKGYDKVGFDNEIYVSTICDNCGHEDNLMGKIQWGDKPKIETYNIRTGLGKVNGGDSLSFLTDEEAKELDTIGYTGKGNDGIRTTRLDFLNRLGKGEFKVNQTQRDSGDFSEAFTITRVL